MSSCTCWPSVCLCMITSHLPKLTVATVRSMHREPATAWGGVGWGTPSTQDAHGPAAGIHGQGVPAAHGHDSRWTPDTVNRIHIPLMPSENLPASSHPQSFSSLIQYSEWREREMGFFGSTLHSWRSQALHFHPRKKSRSRRSLLALKCAVLAGRGHWENQIASLTLRSASKLVIFALTEVAGISVLETWASKKALSSVGDCLRWCFPGAARTQPRGARVNSWATAGSTAQTEVGQPVPGVTPLPGCLSVWCWIPELTQRYFYPLTDAKLLLLKRGYAQGASYSVMLLTSL